MKINVVFGLLIMVLGFSACLKNEDNTAEGPKAQLTVINASYNTPAFDLTIDKNKLTTTPIAFGAASGLPGNIYLPVEAGLRQMIMTSSSTTLLDKNFGFDANKYYSFFVYDTLKNNTANISIIIDDTTTVDTLGKARFFHLIPGNYQLSALMIKAKDTSALATSVVYPSGSGSFPTTLKPGSYRMELKLNGSVIYKDTPVVIHARSLYTFIAKGTSGGTGVNAPSVMILQNK